MMHSAKYKVGDIFDHKNLNWSIRIDKVYENNYDYLVVRTEASWKYEVINLERLERFFELSTQSKLNYLIKE